MAIRVVFENSAIRDLRRLPSADRERIIERINDYANERPADVKRLAGRDEYRLRMGNYRVLFTRVGDTATILRIAHRKDVYR